MKKTIFAIAAAMLLSTSALAADKFCEGAVSASACANHRAYVASLKEIPDTSPDYMKRIDPRYNAAMNTAGGGAGGDGAGAGTGQ